MRVPLAPIIAAPAAQLTEKVRLKVSHESMQKAAQQLLQQIRPNFPEIVSIDADVSRGPAHGYTIVLNFVDENSKNAFDNEFLSEVGTRSPRERSLGRLQSLPIDTTVHP
jgi:hypothetical protein